MKAMPIAKSQATGLIVAATLAAGAVAGALAQEKAPAEKARDRTPLPRGRGRILHVSTSGNDAANGLSEQTPWRTIARAARPARAGDTVRIKGGKYDGERVVLANSGTERDPIVLEGCDGTPVLDGGDPEATGILVSGREHILLKNIKLVNYGRGVRIQGSRHIVVDGVVCHDMGKGNRGVGFSVSARTQYSVLSNCETRNCAMHGLNLMAESSHNLIEEPGSGAWAGVAIRGGDGVIFRNVIRGYRTPVNLSLEGGAPAGERTGYPRRDQVREIYVWENDPAGVTVSRNAAGHIKKDRDYFERPRPEYEPYVYPRPLAAGGPFDPVPAAAASKRRPSSPPDPEVEKKNVVAHETAELYNAARQAERGGLDEVARTLYERLIERYPGSPLAEKARERLGR